MPVQAPSWRVRRDTGRAARRRNAGEMSPVCRQVTAALRPGPPLAPDRPGRGAM